MTSLLQITAHTAAKLVGLAMATTALLAGTASAQDGMRVADVQAAMGVLGEQGQVQGEGNNVVLLTGRMSRHGLNYVIFVGGCDAGPTLERRCDRLEYAITFLNAPRNTSDLNQWNLNSPAQGFLNGDGDPTMQHYVVAPRGVSRSFMEDNMMFFQDLAVAFRSFSYSSPSTPVGSSGTPVDVRQTVSFTSKGLPGVSESLNRASSSRYLGDDDRWADLVSQHAVNDQ